MVVADARMAVSFSLSPGDAGDAPKGSELSKKTMLSATYVAMDRAYEVDETRRLEFDVGLTPVVPPTSNRMEPWQHDRRMHKKRTEVEHLFRRLMGF